VQVVLRGSSASTVIVGILLLTRARRLGERVAVSIVGDPEDVASVQGPALVYSPVLSGCGVGRVAKRNALVCMPGPASEPLALSMEDAGLDEWFEIDRSGAGTHASTRAVISLCRHPEPEGQNLGRVLRNALAAVGCPAETALLDLLFGAPLNPLHRLALSLRVGREMTGQTGDPFTRFVRSGIEDLPDPLPTPLSAEGLREAVNNGHVGRLLRRLQPGIDDEVQDWLEGVERVDALDGFAELVRDIAEVGSHLVALPMAGMLPTLPNHQVVVAEYLGRAIGSVQGQQCAMAALIETYEFLGGVFIEHSPFAVAVPGSPPPSGRMERWQWLCQTAHLAIDETEALWDRLVVSVQ
jgi:hypothetical protein